MRQFYLNHYPARPAWRALTVGGCRRAAVRLSMGSNHAKPTAPAIPRGTSTRTGQAAGGVPPGKDPRSAQLQAPRCCPTNLPPPSGRNGSTMRVNSRCFKYYARRTWLQL